VFAVSLSPTWRGIVLTFSTRESIAIRLKSSIGFKVGDDSNIWSWIDSWLGTPAPLHNLFPRLFNLSLQQLVSHANVYSPIDNSVSLTWRRNLRSRELCTREILIAGVERGLVFSGGEDSKACKFDSSNTYSVLQISR
jgi:hypothetical protein